jgi:hypothetical protein
MRLGWRESREVGERVTVVEEVTTSVTQGDLAMVSSTRRSSTSFGLRQERGGRGGQGVGVRVGGGCGVCEEKATRFFGKM